jgi:3D-(3,5/4)-trihydroxycyclohexane-1,2-dione acylhydrolase (decyclizing)
LEKRVWRVPRNRPDPAAVRRAAEWIRNSHQPLIVAGGGVIYSDATAKLCQFVEQTGIPVAETFAGRGSLRYDNPLSLGAVGATGTLAANQLAREADLVLGIGTRYSDFTTASKTAFQHPDVRFVNINAASFDAAKHSALPLVGDAQVTLAELHELLDGYQVSAAYRARAQSLHTQFQAEIDRVYATRHQPLPSQAELVGALNEHTDPDAVIVCAAGSLPGDLDKLWRARHPKQFHLEYGYSCMGYEIPGGLGVKMADPTREVYALVGDGNYLMMNGEIVTSIQEGYKLTIVLMDNDGFKSIGGLSRSIGSAGFGTRYVYRGEGLLDGDDGTIDVRTLPVDLAANARSLGAHVIQANDYAEFVAALDAARATDRTTVIHVRNDRLHGVPDYEGWWDVPVAEVSDMPAVQAARATWETGRARERSFL